MLLFSKKIGPDGMKKITAKPAAAFTIQQMAGGKAAGKDFSKQDWKFVRIYEGKGEGQVAGIVEKGPGFLRVDVVLVQPELENRPVRVSE